MPPQPADPGLRAAQEEPLSTVPDPVGEAEKRVDAWRVLVPLTALAAGMLFALSASTSQGTDLRAERRDLADLIDEVADDVSTLEAQAAALRRVVERSQQVTAASDGRVLAEQERAAALVGAAGLTEVAGPGVRVSLDDAPRSEDGVGASANPDDLVVHQQDLQAVVNALWAGGAEAMTLMGQRIVSTSAVRCVGNTVVLHGQVFGPPFVVEAIGEREALTAALDAAPGVAFFQTFVERFGLGYDVELADDLTLPAYDRSLELPALTPARSAR